MGVILVQTVFGQDDPTLKLIFTGDIMGHDSQIESALNTGSEGYDYAPCFEHLEPYFSSADITIGNLEVTLAGPPYKGYPQFSSPDELGLALRSAGFDILLTANNHALDRHKQGIERTIDQLDKQGFIYTGTFKNDYTRALSYPLLVEKNGIRLAILNYTYGTNGLVASSPNIVNYIDTAQISKDLKKAEKASPDFTIVTVHWGKEYENTENSQQNQLAQFILDAGADAIIGSHPHVVQPIRLSDSGEIIVYSMGNLISNQRSRYRNGGIAFEMSLEKKEGITAVSEYAYLPIWVYKPVTEKGTQFQLMPAALDSATAKKLHFPDEDYALMKTFLNDTRTNLTGHPEIFPVWMSRGSE